MLTELYFIQRGATSQKREEKAARKAITFYIISKH